MLFSFFASVMRVRRLAALAATATRWRFVGGLAASRAALLAAAGHGIDRGPGTTGRFFFTQATVLVALFDVLRLPLLLVGISRLVSSRHDRFLLSPLAGRQQALQLLGVLLFLGEDLLQEPPRGGI